MNDGDPYSTITGVTTASAWNGIAMRPRIPIDRFTQSDSVVLSAEYYIGSLSTEDVTLSVYAFTDETGSTYTHYRHTHFAGSAANSWCKAEVQLSSNCQDWTAGNAGTPKYIEFRLWYRKTGTVKFRKPMVKLLNATWQPNLVELSKTATNYITADSTGIRIASANPSTATTYQHQTASATEFYVGGVKRNQVDGTGMTVYDANGDEQLNVSADGVTMGGHSSAVGTKMQDTTTTARSGSDINTLTTGASLSLTTGVWMINASWNFEVSANSSSPRGMQVVVGTGPSDMHDYTRIYSPNGNFSRLKLFCCKTVMASESPVQFYVMGSSTAAQKSDTTDWNGIEAIRLS